MLSFIFNNLQYCFFVGHDFSRAENAPIETWSFTGCEELQDQPARVSGHDFSRAVSAAKSTGLQPLRDCRQTRSDRWGQSVITEADKLPSNLVQPVALHRTRIPVGRISPPKRFSMGWKYR